VIATGDDDDVVPVVQLEQFLERFLVDECAGDVFLSVFPCGFFAGEAHSAPLPSFVVDKPGHIWEVDLISDFVLITADHPIVGRVTFRDVAGPVLNAGVVVRAAPEREPQIKVRECLTFEYQESVALGWRLWGCFAVDCSVAHGPEPRVPIPSGEVFAVEELLHSRGFGRGENGR